MTEVRWGMLSTAAIGRVVIRARLAATLRLPEGRLGQFDVGLDLVRRDELELIGTEGTLRIPDVAGENASRNRRSARSVSPDGHASRPTVPR
jgi:hypothetical protein